MSVKESIQHLIEKIPQGEPFTNSRFLRLGSRAAVDKTLSRLVEQGSLQRVARGVFVRPKQSRFVGNVMPDVSRVVQVIAKDHGETIQVHGAEAARRFKLSSQMPTTPVYYTSGPTREIRIGNLKVKLMHTGSQRKLQHAGKRPGLALSALWYLGKENVNVEIVRRIRDGLSKEEFETLQSSRMPAWMSEIFRQYEASRAHG
ncbi:hypothetical protein MSNKSG1_16751 [Marinobacter santoriniensis NKSG1]|uniref:Transcriptional regulator, AbiEi antitoxin, Type IV TA system n=1 Tax=Marinobacter santoriniensis NKSG1 TaxID=1288826 RepID=M7D9A0_9GAMM|nr:DUF6088 family protein [Marinobacter santoriniensis]EMP54247.1 hypothetical protein MSNKSG1_16751 [Marinobacter santoriniensis NKSG1]